MVLYSTRAPLLPISLLFFIFSLSISHAASELPDTLVSGDDWNVDRRWGDSSLLWRRSIAEGDSHVRLSTDNASFTLAEERTRRKDPLNGNELYTGGWNISNKNYWASVAFDSIVPFAVAIVWFIGFGLVLLLICCCFCCCRRQSYSYSRMAYAISLTLLILFTCAAIIGCAILFSSQEKFHNSTSATLDYVVGQANFTVDNLRNFSDNLSTAKKIGVEQIFLPPDITSKIDMLETKLNASANELATHTLDNSSNIHDVLDSVRLELIIIAGVMLVLAFLGFLLSLLGLEFCVYILVVIGWVLVAGTFIYCGIFLLLHNVLADTCVAMDEWVTHPHAHTALDDILPCVDVATANESLYQSKEVTFQLANLVNKVIQNISNADVPPGTIPFYYNQSGPFLPMLCNPYAPDLSNRTCMIGEVDFNAAPQVWRGYVCNASGASGFELCTSPGRITPSIYTQMTAAVSVSHGLYYYGPFLVDLLDCTFVRDTFSSISANNCPGLGIYSRLVYIGLAIVSSAVMLSLIFWAVYAKERRHRKYNKQFFAQSR